MKRRNFLSLIGAAAAAPMLPAMGGANVAATSAGYTRYMYGLGVFQARTRAGLTTADLMTRLRLSPAQASAMMQEMTARGVFAQSVGAARVVASQPIARKPYVRRALRELSDQLDRATQAVQPPQTDETPEISENSTGRCTDGVQVVHGWCCDDQPQAPTTSRGSKL